jgi:uncharacterized oxidoreductase
MTISDDDFYEKATAEITTNIVAPLHLTSLFIKLKSLNTINVTLDWPCATFKGAVYCATKAFFHSFTLSMRHLLKEKTLK